jgi:hypothetical protein
MSSILSLCSPANTTTETSKGNSLFVGQNIFQVSFGFDQGHLPDGKRCFPGVLQGEIKTQSQIFENTVKTKQLNKSILNFQKQITAYYEPVLVDLFKLTC